MDVSDFDFTLPFDLIAQEPAGERGTSRLLILDRSLGRIAHGTIADLPDQLRPGDVLVVNNTRVFPARLIGRRVPSGGAAECLLLERLDDERWDALVHPGQKLRPGTRIVFEAGPVILHAEVLERRFFGRRTIALEADDDGPGVEAAIDVLGQIPLPPYIRRPATPADRERYQTVFARERGSVAAPTAGLHLTEALLQEVQGRGIELVEVTLHVGYGTFQPVRAVRVEDHTVDPERYSITDRAAQVLNHARRDGRRLVAVGTTTTRVLEAAVRRGGGVFEPGGDRTGLFIHPGVPFEAVGGLLTNFHLPRSSLLMLICAFAGRQPVLHAYAEAVRSRYRFYSYGDAMLIL